MVIEVADEIGSSVPSVRLDTFEIIFDAVKDQVVLLRNTLVEVLFLI